MARSDRLFRLLHALRSLPAPVTAARLAAETGVSPRTLYRDIDALRAGGALIDGAAGYGYTLTEDPSLPPQTFSRLEIEALVLGLGEAAQRGDAALAEAAMSALSKISATLPDRLQRQIAHAVGLVHRLHPRPAPSPFLPLIREACWEEQTLDIGYRDAAGAATERRVRPLAIAYLDSVEMLLAWCCLRNDFRMFRTDRIAAARPAGVSFRPNRASLLRAYIARLRGDAA